MSLRPLFRRPLVPALLALGLSSFTIVPQQAHAQSAQSASQKPVLTTLHRFDGTHGSNSNTPLTLGTNGSFYGVTIYGGLNYYGTVFSMTPEGQFTTLFRFNGKNGSVPVGGLVQGADGAFYGMTQQGGSTGSGTVFRITPTGQLTTLHSFVGTDGSEPSSALLPAPDGSFYGTTIYGGSNNSGTLVHIKADGQVATLHSFVGMDGQLPLGKLAFGSDGAIYGTAFSGGRKDSGVVYRLTTDGTSYTVLHSFTDDGGSRPESGLTAGPDGALYGVTSYGGIGSHNSFSGGGVAYKITPSGTFTTLHKFSEDGHGTNPFFALTLGTNGDLYGTTVFGGTKDKGTVFRMTPAGQVTTLYKFHTDLDGYNPRGGLAFGPDDALYGTTGGGGAKGYGTIFKLTLPQ